MEPEVEVEPEVDELGGEETFDAAPEEEVPPATRGYEEGISEDAEISEDADDNDDTDEDLDEQEHPKQKITNKELVNYISQRVAERLAEKKKA